MIVPVVPLATYSSAAQVIAEEPFVKELINSNELSKSTINSISLYFKNQRQINAFLAQFYLNCKKLPHLKMFDKVFAITSLMVLFPHFSHSLYNKNNYLDLLLSEKWSLNDGIPTFASGRQLPQEMLNYKDSGLFVFLNMCITRELITKSYRLLLTAHKVADNNILSEKDVELLIAFFSGIDISNERFENPDNVLERIDDIDFINKPYNFYPQLLDCMVDRDDKNKLKLFKDSIDSMENHIDRSELITYLINECSDLTVDYIAKMFVSSPFAYNIVSNIREGRNYFFALILLTKTKLDFLKNNKNLLKDYFTFVSSSLFLENQKKNLLLPLVEKLINSGGFVAKDISVFKDDDSVLPLFKKNLCFEINVINILVLYPSFKANPFATLNENKEICDAFLINTNSSSILEECESDVDIKSFVNFFINKTLDNNLDKLLESKYFNPTRFKLKLGTGGDVDLSIGQLKINSLLKHNLLDLNSAYLKWYISNDNSIFVSYLKNSSSIINEYEPKFESDLSSFLFAHLAKEELINYAKLLDYSFLTKDISSISAEKLFEVIDYIDDDNAEKLLEKAAIANDSLFNSICERKSITLKDNNKIILTRSEIAYIFENNIENYYPLILSATNYEIFEKYVAESAEGMDFAKLIFLEDGTLRSGINNDSLALVCRYEIDNDGALEKVFNNVDSDSLKSVGWIGFIDTYVSCHGSIDKFEKFSLPINKTNELIYNKFIAIKRIFAAKGNGKNKLYFTLNQKNLLF